MLLLFLHLLKMGVWESMVCLFLKIKENILLFIPHYLKNGYIDLWISCDLSAGKKPWNIFIGFVILLSFYRFCLLATNFLVYLLTCTLLIQLLAYCIDNFFVWIFQMMINILYHLVTVLHCCDGDKKDSPFV
jgi:hypothetical protein